MTDDDRFDPETGARIVDIEAEEPWLTEAEFTARFLELCRRRLLGLPWERLRRIRMTAELSDGSIVLVAIGEPRACEAGSTSKPN
jgi:hypothetical protein